MPSEIDDTRTILRFIKTFIDNSPWKNDYSATLAHLVKEIDNPCELAVAGRVKAGKSSFINALLGADLAKTGTTETTATINYFKYGNPSDPEKPVLCVYTNGREAWVGHDFLNSLQDHTPEALQKAEGIKHLEYYLPDPRLEKITLVDTPGFDAIVGEDGEGHEKVSDQYLLKKLRDRHSQETEDISNSADAVIYLIGQVATASAQGILQEFQKASGGSSSAMNAIGIMAKIDMNDAIMTERHDLAKSAAQKLEKELNTVVPVSAGLYRAWQQLKAENRINEFQNKIRLFSEKQLERLLTMETTYKRSLLNESPLSVEERIHLKGDMPWRVFVVIAKELYNNNIELAEKNILDLSGMDNLKKMLEEHFFERGRILRCNRIANDGLKIIRDIENDKLYILRKKTKEKEEYLQFIKKATTENTKSIAIKIIQLIEDNFISENEILKLEDELRKVCLQLEELLLNLNKTNKAFKALKLIEESYNEFTEEERKELFEIFGQFGRNEREFSAAELAKRQMYWKKEMNWARSSNRKLVAQTAIEKYGSL